MTHPYRIHARIKNNRLWTAIHTRWPAITQKKAAQRLGVSETDLGRLLNMRTWPGQRNPGSSGWYKDGWTRLAWKVATGLKETPDYLFDPALYGLTAEPIQIEIDRPALEGPDQAGLYALPPAPDEELERQELHDLLIAALTTLPAGEAEVVRCSFGLDGEAMTLAEIGARLGVTGSRVQQIRQKALSHLRRKRGLRDLCPPPACADDPERADMERRRRLRQAWAQLEKDT